MASKILHLNLHRKWFDLIASGAKKEEYRAITPYWCARLLLYEGKKRNQIFWQEYLVKCGGITNVFLTSPRLGSVGYRLIEFANGYAKTRPTLRIIPTALIIGTTNPEWCDAKDRGKTVFILRLGDIVKP